MNNEYKKGYLEATKHVIQLVDDKHSVVAIKVIAEDVVRKMENDLEKQRILIEKNLMTTEDF